MGTLKVYHLWPSGWSMGQAGPVHTCRQHLTAVEEDAEEEDDGEEHVKFLSITGKWPASWSGRKVPQDKKGK